MEVVPRDRRHQLQLRVEVADAQALTQKKPPPPGPRKRSIWLRLLGKNEKTYPVVLKVPFKTKGKNDFSKWKKKVPGLLSPASFKLKLGPPVV